MEPAVSIVICAHQAHAFLGEALDSALAQGFGDFEILIAPDEAADYLEFAGRDPRVRLLPPVAAPSGPAGARNRALAQAKGRFLVLLDADDMLSPGYLDLLVPLAERHGCAFGRTSIVAAGLELRSVPPLGYAGPASFELFGSAFGSFHGIARRAESRRWRDVLAEDVLFDLETLALAGGAAPYAPDAVYTLRRRPGSVTQTERFVARFDAAYARLLNMIEEGETDIPNDRRAEAMDVFRAWRAMNARFVAARRTDAELDFQEFVASVLPEVERVS